MNPNTKSILTTVGLVLGSILSAVAMHGKAAVDALAGVPALLQAWASSLPLGAGSFVLALTLGTLLWITLDRKRPPLPCGKSRSFSNDTLVLCLCVVVVSSEQWVAGLDRRGALLNALLVGATCGLLSPYLGRGLRALFRKPAP